METLQQSMFAPANTEHIIRENQAPIRVVMGNPPYNVGQRNENDNNKNRRHPRVDARIRETYGAASKATLQNKLYDMYVKFFRWATDRLDKRDGVVCFISNNGFLDGIAFDGFRANLLKDFTRVYHFDLKGNAHTSGERRRREGGNIFSDQIRTGVGITLLVRNAKHNDRLIFYHCVGDYWDFEQKRAHLVSFHDYSQVDWRILSPNRRDNWFAEVENTTFDTYFRMGAKGLDVEGIFKT
jgi:predicted helicase